MYVKIYTEMNVQISRLRQIVEALKCKILSLWSFLHKIYLNCQRVLNSTEPIYSSTKYEKHTKVTQSYKAIAQLVCKVATHLNPMSASHLSNYLAKN